MPIISISRGSHSRGVEVAQKVADKLGYACLARDAVLDASGEYNVPEIKLVQAIEDAPSIIDRLTHGKARYVTYIRATLLRHFLADNLVYHGLAGHFFLQGVRHALKVRILADPADRVSIVMARDGVSEKDARAVIAKGDKARRQWAMHMYGIDPEDASLYDAVIHVGKIGTDGAADAICSLAQQDTFQTTPESRAMLEDMALAAGVEALLVDMYPDQQSADVTADGGDVRVRLKTTRRVHAGSYSDFDARYVEDVRSRLAERALQLPGIRGIEVELRRD